MNILDLIILLILLLGAWGGFRRGLILTCGGLLGFLGGIWLAGRYYITAAQYLGTQLGLDKLFTRILIPLTAGIPSTVPAIKATGGATFPGWPPSLWVPVSGAAAGVSGQGMAQMLAAAIVKAIAFFLIMALVSYLVMILASFISRVAHLLFMGGLDRLGGVGLGLGTRALEMVVIIGLLTPVVLGLSMGLPVQGGWLHSFFQAWNQSALIPYFNRTWNLVSPSMNNFFTMI